MPPKKKKGLALITVVVVMLVLSILGLSLLGVSLAEAKHAEWEDKRIQAHYIGRSGVYVGIKMLDAKLASENITNINTFVTQLNSYVATLDSSTFKVGDKGTFTLKYEVFESGRLKIRCVGTVNGNPNMSETVTYAVEMIPSMSMLDNPDVWISGINLRHNINRSTNFLGKGVMLSSKPIQSPMGGGASADSTFQASVIYFKNNNGISFKQITNSVDITFDSEILYFESGVQLNKTGDDVFLAISPETIKYRMEFSGVLPIYCPPVGVTPQIVGFEDYGRYKAFIGTETKDLHSTYEMNFEDGKNYGVVYFGDAVVVKEKNKDTPITNVNRGYYYFKNGVNLRSLTPSHLGDNLIRIPDDDAIIKAIQGLFKSKTKVDGAFWDRK